MSTAAEVVDVGGLTSEWLSDVLQREVRLDACERIGTGVTAATYRLEIAAEGMPSSIIAKIATGEASARERVRGGFRAEVGFYAHLQSTVDVRAPQCWYAAISEDALTFTLLLEDLAPRVPGVQVEGCSIAQAQGAVRNLAALHAPRWNDPTLLEHEFLRRADAASSAFLGGLTISSTKTFLDLFGDDLSSEDASTLQAAAEAIGGWILARPEPFALLHGDYRLDNLMFGTDDEDVVAVDWQTAMIGLPARDLAFFLGTSLATEDRRRSEESLVGDYHVELVANGVADYSFERCFEDYRAGQLQTPMIMTIGAALATSERTPQSDAMFLSMASRSCAAIRDLRSLELL